MQNKMVRFILKLDSRAHIGNDELVNAGFLSVVDRVKQLKLGHVFKIKNKSCPIYLRENFLKLDENTHRSKNLHKVRLYSALQVHMQGSYSLFSDDLKVTHLAPNYHCPPLSSCRYPILCAKIRQLVFDI